MSRQPGFFQGVMVAAVLAVTGTAGVAGLAVVMTNTAALTAMVFTLSGVYLVYLLRGSAQRVGRIATFSAWAAFSVGGYLFDPGLMFTILTQVLAVSVVRSLYYHSSLLSGLLDLLLSACSLAAAVWAAQSGSLLLTFWSFFLVQALFTGIPLSFRTRSQPESEDEFDRARRAAQGALNRLASQQ